MRENLSKILQMCCLVFVLSRMIMPIGKAQERERKRELYQRDFYLSPYRTQELQNDSEAINDDWFAVAKEQEEDEENGEDEEETKKSRDWHEDENQIVMTDDFFVVPPEGRQREDILFLYFMPGLLGVFLLSIIWVYFKTWLNNKRELHRTRQRLLRLRQEFRGKPTAPEFHARLKEILKLPPGATSRDINREMPVRDNELQSMINKYDDKFRKSDS
jgi:hypothetical protein